MKRQPKFKVGDKVKILRASTESEYSLWGDNWMFEMNEMIGKTVIISGSMNYGERYQYHKYRIEQEKGFSYCYPEFVLQDITIGKQLLFNFMSKATT